MKKRLNKKQKSEFAFDETAVSERPQAAPITAKTGKMLSTQKGLVEGTIVYPVKYIASAENAGNTCVSPNEDGSNSVFVHKDSVHWN
ncbi:MAG: hypothetical protein KBC17_02020 [Candidatus Pacebacteria bacterium]|nr:hypothetical protein [Candidatus Paceibacterota bacterium]